MSTLFQDEILKIGGGRNDSRSSTPFTYDSDCSGSGFEQQSTNVLYAESIFEWRWPPEDGDWYFLQEHIKEYLQTRNFHRRYPDIHRHPIGAEERNYLIDSGILNDFNSAFSYIAIQADDALDIMKEDFPAKYKVMVSLMRKRELAKKIKAVIKDADEADKEADSGHVCCALKDVLSEDAAAFNKRLRTNHGAVGRKYTCPSTELTLVPRNEQYVAPRSYTRRGKYPIAVIPGQYTDNVPKYSSEQLFTLAVNTPLVCNAPPVVKPAQTVTAVPRNITVTCLQCNLALGKSENVIKCNRCRGFYHTRCINISKEMLKIITRYPWFCPACKTCSVCDAPDGEENLMFCDICDRGYHTYCVNMSDLPRGRWECRLCVMCTCCGANVPGDGPWRFQHDRNMKFLQTMCYACTLYFDKGWFCPVCLKVFDYDAVDDPMVCCDFCDRWVHTGCDNIDDDHYNQLGESGSLYKCILCRGEKEEVYDKHHKKHKEGNKENRGAPSPPPQAAVVEEDVI